MNAWAVYCVFILNNGIAFTKLAYFKTETILWLQIISAFCLLFFFFISMTLHVLTGDHIYTFNLYLYFYVYISLF